jgi:hypothetical protein
MPDIRQEVGYLREKARQFRVLAQTHETGVSDRLLEIAADLEDRADQLEERVAAKARP